MHFVFPTEEIKKIFKKSINKGKTDQIYFNKAFYFGHLYHSPVTKTANSRAVLYSSITAEEEAKICTPHFKCIWEEEFCI